MAMLCQVCSVVHVFFGGGLLSLQFPMSSYQVLKAKELSSEDGSNENTQTRGEPFELAMDHLGP